MFEKGYKPTNEHKRKIGEGNKGKIVSNEARQKISKGMKGKRNSLGNKHTEETKRKTSEALKGRIKSEETKRKMSKAHKGEKSYLWKGGITSLRNQIYNSRKWKKWRSDIFERDNWTCQTCEARSQAGKSICLEAHHIKRFSKIIEEYQIKTLEEALICEELWDTNNGITLCKDCHNLTKKICEN